MASKLIPSDPAKVMVIREVVPNTITTYSTPFWRFGRIKIGGRGTAGELVLFDSWELIAEHDLVRLQSGAVAVFSPVALTDEVKQSVAKLGEVKYIAALDIEVRLCSQRIPQIANVSSITYSSVRGTLPILPQRYLDLKVSRRSERIRAMRTFLSATFSLQTNK